MWQQGILLATASDHTPSQAQPRVFGALLATLLRADDVLQQRVDDAVEFTERHGFHMWRGFATCLRAGVERANGHHAAAVMSVKDGRAALEATGARFLSPMVSVIEARVLAAVGDQDRAWSVLRDAQRHQEATGERWMAAEVWRTIGDMHRLTLGGDAAAAESAYQSAVALAQEQGGKSWELRAASSLADLWIEQGEHQRAGELLRHVCGHYPSGLRTADLADAERLLAKAYSG